jgi:hypothetical protein
MTAATISAMGTINGAGAADALFLKVFSGEVMALFQKESKFLSRHMVRTIEHGKSAQFPIMGRNSASYHTPGAEILGTAVPMAETVIVIDDLLIAHTFVAKIEEAKNHYDVRAMYSTEQGYALVQRFDSNIAQLAILAARTAHPLTSYTAPTRVITDATYRTDGEALAAGIARGAQALDEGNVPDNDRFCAVLPAQYWLLAQTTKVLNRDWGGAGSFSQGQVAPIGGIEVVKTNNLPQTNVNTGPSAYQGNFTNTAAVVWQKSAVGTLKLLDLSSEMEWDIRRQGTLMVSKYAMGHGVLRVEAGVELKVA